jgi:hypothetical protein
MKITTQFNLRFWFLILFLIAVGSLAIYQARLLITWSGQLQTHPLTVSQSLHDIHLNLVEMQSRMKELAIVKPRADSEAVQQSLSELDKKIEQSLEIIKNNNLSDDQLDIDYIIKLFSEWKPVRDEIIRLHNNDRLDQVNSVVFSGKNAEIVEKIEKNLKKWLVLTNSQTDEFLNAAKLQTRQSLFIAIGIAALMFITLWMMFSISRNIGNQVGLALEMADAMAAGHLTEHLQCDSKTATGQLVQALETTQTRLNESRQELERMQTQLRLLEEQKRQLVQEKCTVDNLRHNKTMDKVFTSFIGEEIV